jgi:hypothetical protein
VLGWEVQCPNYLILGRGISKWAQEKSVQEKSVQEKLQSEAEIRKGTSDPPLPL